MDNGRRRPTTDDCQTFDRQQPIVVVVAVVVIMVVVVVHASHGMAWHRITARIQRRTGSSALVSGVWSLELGILVLGLVLLVLGAGAVKLDLKSADAPP